MAINPTTGQAAPTQPWLVSEPSQPTAGTELGAYRISIAGLDKAEILATFFNESVSKYEVNAARAAGIPLPHMTVQQARHFIKNGDQCYIDFFGARCLKLSMDNNVLFTFFYNHIYGEGKAEQIIKDLVKKQN